jgi:hypothetical protein
VSSVPLWWGSVLPAPAPAACLGVLQEATLHQTGGLTRSDTPLKPRSPSEPYVLEPRELYEPAYRLQLHLVTTRRLANPTGKGFVRPVMPTWTRGLSLAAGHGPQGFSLSRPSRSAVASGQP